MASNKAKHSWTRGEKAILAGIIVAIASTMTITRFIEYYDQDPVVHVPTPTLPSPNGFDYFDAASRNVVVGWPMPGTVYRCRQRITSPPPPPGFAGPGGPMPVTRSTPATQPTIGYVDVTADDNPDLHDRNVRAAAVSILARNNGAISTFRLGLKCPCADRPIRLHRWFSMRPLRFRRLAELLALEGQVDAYRHDLDGAVQSALDVMTFGVRIQNGGAGTCYWAGDHIEELGRALLWPQINRLSSAQCRHTASTLDAVDASTIPFAAEQRDEKWWGEASLSESFRRPNWKSQMMTDLGVRELDPSFLSQVEYRLVTKRQLMRNYIAGMDACIAAATQPYGTESATTSSDPISDLFTRRYPEDRFREASTLAQNRLLATACALRAYKLDHGSYPSTLQQLVPSYLHAVPLDPFTAASTLRYRRSGQKYVLYSVGPDMHDDGGAAVTDQFTTGEYVHRVYLEAEGDIVAGVNIVN
jgi:hypothetical protein